MAGYAGFSIPLSLSHLGAVKARRAGFCKNEPLGPNIARYGFWMGRKSFIYIQILSVMCFVEKSDYRARYAQFSMSPSQPADPDRNDR